MKSKIIFQKCNFNYIYFLLYILSFMTMLIIENYLYSDELKKRAQNNLCYFANKEMIEIFTFNLADFIAIIPYFIRKKLVQGNNDNNEYKDKVKLIHKGVDSILKRKAIIFYLFLISAFDFLKEFALFVYYLFFSEKNQDKIPFNYTVIFDIILQFIFSYLILRIPFYKLQHFSLYLNVVILFIILALDLIDILKHKIVDGNIYIVYPFYLIFYCLQYVFGKKIILYGYVNIYIIIIMKGVFKLIFNIIFSLILFKVKKEILITFALYFREKKYILLLFGKVITNFFSELFLWIIIDRFSPNYTPLIIIGEELCCFVIDLIDTKIFLHMGNHKYVRIILYIISLIGVLLHNQMIVINICGLGSDTKYFLDDIVKNEEEYNNTNDPNILKKFETMEMADYADDDSEQIDFKFE